MSNLLQEILSRIEYERLIEEGKDPVEVLHYKYKQIPSAIIDKVIEIDPTKKKTYSQWLLSKWDEESNVIKKNLANGKISMLFQYFKEHNNIQLRNFNSVKEVIRDYVPDAPVWEKSSKPTTYVMNLKKEVPSEKADDFEIVYNDGNWIIAVVNSYEADCKLGENMKWCTANEFGNGYSYYTKYLDDYPSSKYYVNFDLTRGEERKGKEYPYKRYQFHFETKQFKDKEDDQVDVFNIGMPEGAFKYYESIGYKRDSFISRRERQKAYERQREQFKYVIDDGLYLAPKYNHDLIFQEPDENTPFFLFSNRDSFDPVFFEEIKNPFHENVSQKLNNNLTIIKPIDETQSLFCVKSTYYPKIYKVKASSVVYTKNYAAAIVSGNKESLYISDKKDYVIVISFYGNFEKKIKLSSPTIDRIFINKNLQEKEHETFLEIIGDEGFHTLAKVNDQNGVTVLISKDKPINGEFFTRDKNGRIESEFKNMFIGVEGCDDLDISLLWKIPGGNYVVNIRYTDGSVKQNIFLPKEHKFLSENGFAEISTWSKNTYCAVERNRIKTQGYIITVDNNDIICFGPYADVYRIDTIDGIYAGKKDNNKIELINSNTRQKIEIDYFDKFYSNVSKLLVVHQNDVSKLFNCADWTFPHPDITVRDILFNINCKEKFIIGERNGQNIIFSLDTEEILLENIARECYAYDKWLHYKNNIDGKSNLFDFEQRRILLPNNVDKIVLAYFFAIISYNKKYFIYGLNERRVLSNPNGFKLKEDPGVLYYAIKNDSLVIGFNTGTQEILISIGISASNIMEINVYEGNFTHKIEENEIPQKVREYINQITGNPTNPGATNEMREVTKNFNNMLKRINEAIR